MVDSQDVVLSPHLTYLEPKDVWGPGPGEVRSLVLRDGEKSAGKDSRPTVCGVRLAMGFPCLPPFVQVGRTCILPSRKE